MNKGRKVSVQYLQAQHIWSHSLPYQQRALPSVLTDTGTDTGTGTHVDDRGNDAAQEWEAYVMKVSAWTIYTHRHRERYYRDKWLAMVTIG